MVSPLKKTLKFFTSTINFLFETVALVYGVYKALDALFEAQIYKIAAKIIYWIGMLLGPFNLLDTLVKMGTTASFGVKGEFFFVTRQNSS